MVQRYTRHGMTNHPHFRRWRNMVSRCTNPKDVSYARYGGRGITVTPEWVDDPRAFCEWVDEHLGDCPPGHSLDRVDNDGPYEPGNLRWATPQQQVDNQRERRTQQRPDPTPDQRFGRLRVLDLLRHNPTRRNPKGSRAARCLCDCGNECVVLLAHLRSGNTSSCGCLRRETTAQLRNS